MPSIAKRVGAMQTLIDAGWPVGLRLDPIIYHHNYRQDFARLLDCIFTTIDASKLHSVSLGAFRLPNQHFKKVSKLYPEEPLFAQNLTLSDGIVSYPRDQEQEMIEFCKQQLMQFIPTEIYHPCKSALPI